MFFFLKCSKVVSTLVVYKLHNSLLLHPGSDLVDHLSQPVQGESHVTKVGSLWQPVDILHADSTLHAYQAKFLDLWSYWSSGQREDIQVFIIILDLFHLCLDFFPYLNTHHLGDCLVFYGGLHLRRLHPVSLVGTDKVVGGFGLKRYYSHWD